MCHTKYTLNILNKASLTNDENTVITYFEHNVKHSPDDGKLLNDPIRYQELVCFFIL